LNTRNLPSHRFELHRGIATNLRPDELAGKFMFTQQNMDSFDRFRTVGKVPGSTAVSATHGAAVLSLHQFEFFSLAGVLTRHQLSFAADGVLRLIDPSTGALTTVVSGLTSDIMRGIKARNLLFLTSPEQRALATGGLKYDGTRTTNWGVLAPGTAETVQQSFNAHTDWTASTDVTKANSTTSIDGAGSVSVAKTGTATTEAYIERTGLAHNFAALGQDTLFVYLFLPYGVIQKLATSGTAVQVVLGTSGFTNINNYNFSVGELVPGWNLLSMLVNTPDSTGGAGATESNITNVRVRLVTSSSGQTFSGVLWDKLFSQAEGRPTVALGAAGLPNNDYTYRVAFFTEYGLVSNGGPASASITATLDQISLTAIPVSTDTQVIGRLIYRDIDGDGIYRFVGQIDDNVTTTFTDNVADDSLGAADLPLAGDDVFDNSPMGRMHATTLFANRIIGIDADDRFRLKISEIDGPEAARIVDQLVFDESLVALEPHGFGLVLYSTDSTYLMTGDGFQVPFDIQRVSSQVGANSFRSVAGVKLHHMVQHEDQVYIQLNPADPWLANKSRLDHFRDDVTAATRSDGFMIHDRSRYRVVSFNKGSGGTCNQLDVWQYGVSATENVSGDGGGVDPQDIRLGAWHTLALPTNVNPRCAVMAERTADLPELWVGGSDGFVYWLQAPAATTYADGASTAAIDASFETHAVPLGSTTSGRGEPRYVRINAIAGSSTVWAVTLTLLSDADGATVATSTFNVTLGAGKTSVLATVPAVNSRAEWCRVKLANATSAGVGRIKDLELYYVPRVDHRGVRSA
jgi:hypothetical protein